MKYLIGIIIGAIIGYFTNWLAIKMLFKPHKEVRFLGIKVPFTPGLIPKEKDRIAKSVGDAVGDHLLDKETIIDSLCSEKISNSIKLYFKNKFLRVKESEKTIGNILDTSLQLNIDNALKESISSTILNSEINEKIKRESSLVIEKQLLKIIEKNPKEVLLHKDYDKLKNNLIHKGNEYLDSEDLIANINNILEKNIKNLQDSEDKIKNVLPEGLIIALKVYACDNREKIAQYLKDILRTEKTEVKIKDGINKAISGMSPMIAMFLKSDIIYDKVLEYGDAFLSNEENVDDLSMLITNAIDSFSEKSISEVLKSISLENKEEIVNNISKLIVTKAKDNNVVDSFAIKIQNGLFENKNNIEEVLKTVNIDSKDLINKIIDIVNKDILKDDIIKNGVNSMVESLITVIKSKKIKEVLVSVDERIIDNISNNIVEVYNRFMKNSGKQLVDSFNVSRIIEDKINSFEVEFAEKLILEIASKELRAITWLGGLLGGIMGLLSPILGTIL
ncbi:DUF445 family protein [Clostridium senegalense]|uniref:DUF445 family protein n=1 Tax=Clostridium senegalense TaxID=1465809 RepID=UPI001C124D9A|nr:DUF445 family protein [Clostridium senegalense]MBU5227502.1 DUF445 family protein [Clostridium senegalense]